MRRVIQVTFQVPGDIQFIGNFEILGGISRRFAHISMRNILDIRNSVLLLIFLQIFFNTTQFLFDDIQTLIDKLRSISSRSVFIRNPILIIDINDCIDNVRSTIREIILHGQRNYGRFPTRQRDTKIGTKSFCPVHRTSPHDMNIIVPPPQIRSWKQHQLSYRR